MPLQKLQFRPGTNRENTNYSNEGGYWATDKVRFRSGQPEKIGGWTQDAGTNNSTLTPSTGILWGVVRAMWNWLNLSGYNLLGLGSNLKYYIQSNTGGNFYDVTPQRGATNNTVPAVFAVASNAFTTTASSATGYVTVVCNVSSYNAQTGDFVTISTVASAVNGIPAASLNAEFQVTYISSSTFSIQVYVTGAVTAGTTGAASFLFDVSTGGDIYTEGLGWGAGGWGGSSGSIANTTINGGTAVTAVSTTAITATSVTGFAGSGTIFIGSEAITYTTIVGSTFAGTITRGTGSTTAAAHANGSAIYQYASTATGWGIVAPAGVGIGLQLRTWSHVNFGENLIINFRGGAMYFWAVDASPSTFSRAQIILAGATVTQKNYATGSGTTAVTVDSTCPSLVNYVLVSDASRFVIAFGCNDPTGVYASTVLDPMQIRWSNQESYATWTPAITNQAGDYRLSHGSQIVAAVQTRQEILVLTDSAIYSMQYVGPPYVWSFQILGDNISLIGPSAITTVNNITYWMGTDKFYLYDGRVQTLPSTLREYVFSDINLTQGYQVISGTNEGYNEVWWHYCSISGPSGTGTVANPNTSVDRYVIYNHLDQVWYYGTWNNYNGVNQGRTAWLDSALRASPMAVVYGLAGSYANAILVYQEAGVNDNAYSRATNLPIVSYVQSSDFDIGDGNNFGFVWRLIPDLTFEGSNVASPTANFTLLPRTFPGANYGSSNNPAVISANNYQTQYTYPIQLFTQQVYVRLRGRQIAFKISSGTTGSMLDGIGVQWQLGAPRIDIRPDGRR